MFHGNIIESSSDRASFEEWVINHDLVLTTTTSDICQTSEQKLTYFQIPRDLTVEK